MVLLETRITKLLGIKHPVILPGMSWISTPELVAAVSNAGGLGILATGPLTSKQTEESIKKIRSLTDKPFGIGLTLMMPGVAESANIAFREKVPVINFSLGKGDWLVQRARTYGAKVIATVATEKHGHSAKQIGADALMIVGHEAAAHGPEVTTMVLVNSIARKVDLPIIAAGGFADGRGLLSALSIGADAVAMGTRFAVTQESPLHPVIKQTVTEKEAAETLFTKNFDGLPARIMKAPGAIKAAKRPMNPVLTIWRALQQAKASGIPLWKILPGTLLDAQKIFILSQLGAATMKAEQATVHGDLKDGVQFIGQAQGLIDDIPRVADLMDRIIREASDAHKHNASLFTGTVVPW